VLILNKREVETLLSMPQCIELMADALASLSRGEVTLPLRPVLRIGEKNAFAVMPAYSQSLRAAAAKLITVFPDNHGTLLDSHQGAVVVFDGTDGRLLALMDAASITAIRTAAVSGVATRLLARPDAKSVAILGSGVQARTHIDAMLAVRRIERVVVWSRNPGHASALVNARRRDGVFFEVAGDAASAVREADIVCTVTASREPVLHGEWLRPGTHVNAVGASLPTTRELDSAAVKRSRVFVDRRESALNEAGDLLMPIREGVISGDHIVAEIGELLIGQAKGRAGRAEITLFKSLGIAVEDLAAGQFLYERATRERAGTWVDL
jgi:ornithine cyclodeaminase/alanine dehydrogenase-like protein (mu-crystallin family)